MSVWRSIVSNIIQAYADGYSPTLKAKPNQAFQRFVPQLQVGDVVFGRGTKDGDFFDDLIPGFWSHVGLVVSPTTIVEAFARGVQEIPIEQFARRYEVMQVGRCEGLVPEIKARAAAWARRQIGKPYDFAFEASQRAFYCSELCADAFDESGAALVHPVIILGEKTILPDTLASSIQFQRVFTVGV